MSNFGEKIFFIDIVFFYNFHNNCPKILKFGIIKISFSIEWYIYHNFRRLEANFSL